MRSVCRRKDVVPLNCYLTKLCFNSNVLPLVCRHAIFSLQIDAIKILDKSDIKANELTVNVRREIAIMKALNHKNIVNLREVLSSKSKLYIVMDLVRGGELFEMIERRGELDEKLARKYFQQLVDGIDYCHRRGVCHRDLKPENLVCPLYKYGFTNLYVGGICCSGFYLI